MALGESTTRDTRPNKPTAYPLHLRREMALSTELVEASRCDPAAALRRLGCTEVGLQTAEAAARLGQFGANKIAQERQAGIIRELIGRARNPLNALLLTLAAVSYFLGDVRAAIIISAMVILSIVTAFIQEHRSNQAAAKLRALVKTTASVKRPEAALQTSKINGFVEIPMEEIVPGDIVALSAGDGRQGLGHRSGLSPGAGEIGYDERCIARDSRPRKPRSRLHWCGFAAIWPDLLYLGVFALVMFALSRALFKRTL